MVLLLVLLFLIDVFVVACGFVSRSFIDNICDGIGFVFGQIVCFLVGLAALALALALASV